MDWFTPWNGMSPNLINCDTKRITPMAHRTDSNQQMRADFIGTHSAKGQVGFIASGAAASWSHRWQR